MRIHQLLWRHTKRGHLGRRIKTEPGDPQVDGVPEKIHLVEIPGGTDRVRPAVGPGRQVGHGPTAQHIHPGFIRGHAGFEELIEAALSGK
jgi:hypothetical protein